MKKYLKILLFSVSIGGLLAYLFYRDINKEVRAISKKEEVVTIFQTGVFKDYNNALDFLKLLHHPLFIKTVTIIELLLPLHIMKMLKQNLK